MSHINDLNEWYHSKEGDQLAVEELLPVLARYVDAARPRVLEVGAGFGRNLLALSKIPGATVTGCDISAVELAQARVRVAEHGLANVRLVLQPSGRELPFADNSFEIVVLWQVLEHVFSKAEKQALLREVARVVASGGLVLVETPNNLFPFDYHDTGWPLVHWLLPKSWRQYLIHQIRKTEDYPPSHYTTYFGIKKMLRAAGVFAVVPLTKIYFQQSYRDIFKQLGTRRTAKKIFFTLYFPLYLLLRVLGLPGDLFSPSLRLVFRLEKSY